MLDRDLAALYQVKPIALRQAVKRNSNRFPEDFVIQLSKEEAEVLVSQNVIPSRRSLGGFLPYAFTEQGVAMLSSVLRSERAAMVNIATMRTFVRLRQILAAHKELAERLAAMEKKYDQPASPSLRDRLGWRFPAKPGNRDGGLILAPSHCCLATGEKVGQILPDDSPETVCADVVVVMPSAISQCTDITPRHGRYN